MKPLKTLDHYSVAEKGRFEKMHVILLAYNKSLNTDHPLPLPFYTDDEMAEYSAFRELVIAKECEE